MRHPTSETFGLLCQFLFFSAVHAESSSTMRQEVVGNGTCLLVEPRTVVEKLGCSFSRGAQDASGSGTYTSPAVDGCRYRYDGDEDEYAWYRSFFFFPNRFSISPPEAAQPNVTMDEDTRFFLTMVKQYSEDKDDKIKFHLVWGSEQDYANLFTDYNPNTWVTVNFEYSVEANRQFTFTFFAHHPDECTGTISVAEIFTDIENTIDPCPEAAEDKISIEELSNEPICYSALFGTNTSHLIAQNFSRATTTSATTTTSTVSTSPATATTTTLSTMLPTTTATATTIPTSTQSSFATTTTSTTTSLSSTTTSPTTTTLLSTASSPIDESSSTTTRTPSTTSSSTTTDTPTTTSPSTTTFGSTAATTTTPYTTTSSSTTTTPSTTTLGSTTTTTATTTSPCTTTSSPSTTSPTTTFRSTPTATPAKPPPPTAEAPSETATTTWFSGDSIRTSTPVVTVVDLSGGTNSSIALPDLMPPRFQCPVCAASSYQAVPSLSCDFGQSLQSGDSVKIVSCMNGWNRVGPWSAYTYDIIRTGDRDMSAISKCKQRPVPTLYSRIPKAFIQSPIYRTSEETFFELTFKYMFSETPEYVIDKKSGKVDEDKSFYLDVRLDEGSSRIVPHTVIWGDKAQYGKSPEANVWQEVILCFSVPGSRQFSIVFVAHHNNKCSSTKLRTVTIDSVGTRTVKLSSCGSGGVMPLG